MTFLTQLPQITPSKDDITPYPLTSALGMPILSLCFCQRRTGLCRGIAARAVSEPRRTTAYPLLIKVSFPEQKCVTMLTCLALGKKKSKLPQSCVCHSQGAAGGFGDMERQDTMSKLTSPLDLSRAASATPSKASPFPTLSTCYHPEVSVSSVSRNRFFHFKCMLT